MVIDRATLASRITWKTARPASTPNPSPADTNSSPMVTTVMIPIRERVLSASGRRWLASDRVLTLATEFPIIRKLSVPRPRPTQAPTPTSGFPKEMHATRAATPTTRAAEMVRRATSGTLGSEKWANTT